MLATPLARPEPRFSYIQKPNEGPGPVGTSCCRQGVMGPAGRTLGEGPGSVSGGPWQAADVAVGPYARHGERELAVHNVVTCGWSGTGHSGVMDGYRQYEGRL